MSRPVNNGHKCMGSGWGQITCSLEPYISKCVSTTTCDRSSYFSNYMFLLSTRKHTHTHTHTHTCWQKVLSATPWCLHALRPPDISILSPCLPTFLPWVTVLILKTGRQNYIQFSPNLVLSTVMRKMLMFMKEKTGQTHIVTSDLLIEHGW